MTYRRFAAYALLVTASVLLQVVLFPNLRLFGVVPDVGLVLAIAVAYESGAEAAAIVGFFAGLGYDLFLQTPLGTCALAYALTAYGVGVLQTGLLRAPRFVAPFLGFVGGLAGGFAFATLAVLSGSDWMLSWRTLVVIGLAAVYDALIAPFVFFATNRLLAANRAPAAPTSWTLR